MKNVNLYSSFHLRKTKILLNKVSVSINFHIILLCLFSIFTGQSISANEERTVKSIVIREKDSFSAPDEMAINRLMLTRIGEMYDETLFEKDLATIVRYYKNKGFIYARIDNKEDTVKLVGNEIHIGIIIDKGIIGEITLEGNQKTNDKVILQELLFKTGSFYTKDDVKESERILHEKAYISAANIESQWIAEMEYVKIHVIVAEDWSITGAIDPALGSESSTFLLKIQETNLNGSGHGTQLRYERKSETGEQTRSFLKLRYQMPRLFKSYWNFDGEYIQKREGDSWIVQLERPQYSLKSRWSTKFSLLEGVDEVRWYDAGERTAIFHRNYQNSYGEIMRYFGERHQQVYSGIWIRSLFTRHETLEMSDNSRAMPLDRNIKRVGFTIGRKRVYHRQTRFLKEMGPTEYFNTGADYSASIGYASPWFGSERSESIGGISVRSGWTIGDRFLSETLIGISSIFTNQFERSILQAKSTLFFRDTFKSGDDIYTVAKGYRKNGLFEFHHTFVVQFKTEMQFGLSGESQVILGSYSGLRGYDYRQFSGEKMMLLRLESRTVFGGAISEKIDDAVAAIATFCAKPFVDNPIRLGLVLGTTVFADTGYIWNGQHTFDISEPKRSVGIELRGGFSRVSNTGIFRIELAFPLDPPYSPSIKPKFEYGFLRTF
ncbi:MAG: hypothetical protein OXD54_10235 [Candidatus Poribacteria bacterium]|nr:hypothetical protein [Candidatus Poribacteria bacterium]